MESCEHLDDYLSHDLKGEFEAAFVAHLTQCDKCRSAVAVHDQLSHLLRQATNRLEPIPSKLSNSIDRRRRAFRLERFAALAASIAIAITTTWWIIGTPKVRKIDDETVAKQESTQKPNHKFVRISFAANSNANAVPLKSDQPNVSVYWVFTDPVRPPNPQKDQQ